MSNTFITDFIKVTVLSILLIGCSQSESNDIGNNDIENLEFTILIYSDSQNPNKYKTDFYDEGKVSNSGALWVSTGKTIIANAYKGLHTDGYMYNALGKQYMIEEILLSQFGAHPNEDIIEVLNIVTEAMKSHLKKIIIDNHYITTSYFNIKDASDITIKGTQNSSLKRKANGTAGGLITILNSHDIIIDNTNLRSTYLGFEQGPTGSNPLISLTSQQGSLNSNITLSNNSLVGGNLSGILIDGRYELDENRVTNKNIYIIGNYISGAADGVFIYKGAKNIVIEDNEMINMGGGVSLDTQAAGSDADMDIYRIEDIVIKNNSIKNSITYKGVQPRAITLKGGLFNILVEGNIIDVVSSHHTENQPNMGVLIIEDDLGATGNNLTIIDNNISRISNETGDAAWAMLVGKNFTNVSIENNIFFKTDRGIHWSNATSGKIVNNVFNHTALKAQYPLYFSDDTAHYNANLIEVRNNIFHYQSGNNIAIFVLPSSSNINLDIGNNIYNEYTPIYWANN